MTFQIDVRMALFSLNDSALVHQAGVPFKYPPAWASEFAAARSMATVHWSVDPALGLPVAPYLVQVPQRSPPWVDFETGMPAIANLSLPNGFTLDLSGRADIADGLLYVRVMEATPAGVELIAIDLQGDEIVGSRQTSRGPGLPMIFFGPGIMGLRADGPVQISEVRTGRLPSIDGWRTLAEVAPAIGAIDVYNQQSYLGASGLSAQSALAQRLDADALTRQNTPKPDDAQLDVEVHRTVPSLRAQALLDTPLVKTIAQTTPFIEPGPDRSFNELLSEVGPEEVYATMRVCSLLQFLGSTGPIEATTLGCGVSVPTASTWVESLNKIAEGIGRGEAAFSLPLIRVTGYFAAAGVFKDTLSVTTNRASARKLVAIARPVWPQQDDPPTIRAATRVQPEVCDGVAHADVELAFPESARLDAIYLRRSIGGGAAELLREASVDLRSQEFTPLAPLQRFNLAPPMLKRSAPKLFFAVDVDPLEPPDRISRLVDAQVPMPLAIESETADYELHRRDEFGRWDPRQSVACELKPWPVASPTLLSAGVIHAADGDLYLDVRLSWDWRLRRPREIQLAIRTADAPPTEIEGDSSEPASLAALEPQHGVTSPAFGIDQPLWLNFGPDPHADLTPLVVSAGNAVVAIVAPTDTEASGGPDEFNRSGFDERTYRVTVKLGDSQSVFATSCRVRIAVVADALEWVSGTRRSPASAKRFTTALDARPPQLQIRPWTLTWTCLPNRRGEARAVLPPPGLSGGTMAGYTVWRAHETSFMDLLSTLPLGLEGFVAPIRAEENMTVRLGRLKSLIDYATQAMPGFTQEFIALFAATTGDVAPDQPVEVSVPGAQTGLEFFFFTLRSATDMVSDKSLLADVRAVAVPQRRSAARPALSVLTADDGGLFAVTGECLFIVSSQDPFDDSQVRLFWEDRPDIIGEDELFIPFDAFWPVAISGIAGTYLSDQDSVDALLNRQPYRFCRVYLAKPPRRWLAQGWTVDLKTPSTGLPADDIPSVRAPLVRCLVPPLTVPMLSLLPEKAESMQSYHWTVTFENLPLMNTAFGESQLLVEYATADVQPQSMRQTFSMTSLVDEVGQLPIAADMKIGVRITGPGTLVVETTFALEGASLRLVARDPLWRSATLTLDARTTMQEFAERPFAK